MERASAPRLSGDAREAVRHRGSQVQIIASADAMKERGLRSS